MALIWSNFSLKFLAAVSYICVFYCIQNTYISRGMLILKQLDRYYSGFHLSVEKQLFYITTPHDWLKKPGATFSSNQK